MASKIPGLSIQSLKTHTELVPMFASIAFGTVLAFGYLGRLASRCPDVSWNRKANPEPWNKWKQTDRYRFMSVTHDYKNKKFPEGRPDMSSETYTGV